MLSLMQIDRVLHNIRVWIRLVRLSKGEGLQIFLSVWVSEVFRRPLELAIWEGL